MRLLAAFVLALAGAQTQAVSTGVLDAARARYACKGFDPARPVTDTAVRQLAEVAALAPSSFNVQPWTCVLVRDQAARERLAPAMLGANGKRVREAPLVAVFASDLRSCNRAPMARSLAAAAGAPESYLKALPFYVSLFASGYRFGWLRWPMFLGKRLAMALLWVFRAVPKLSTPETWAFKNTMPAASHLMLRATELGLQSLPMEGFDERRVRGALGIPARYAVPVIVAVGHATPKAAAMPRVGRAPIPELFRKDSWREPFQPAPSPNGG